MNKRYIVLSSALMLFCLTGCGNVDKTVDNLCKTSEYTVENRGEVAELSTANSGNVDKTVDKSVDAVDSDVKTEETTVDDIMEQAKYYYYYYATAGAMKGLESNLVFSKTNFQKAWDDEKDKALEDYYSLTGWYDRGEYYSLQFHPRKCLFAENCDNVYQWMARCMKGYSLAVEEYSDDELWGNEESLLPQYHCHAIYAGSKKLPWYIEPHRTETDFLVICAAKGNPAP